MARPREFEFSPARDSILDAFWARGYEATSMSDLEKATHLSRSSLYTAFGNKRQLFDAALARYNETTIEPTLRDLEAFEPGAQALPRYLKVLADTFRSDPELAVRGCLVVNTMVELSSHDEDARQVADNYLVRVRNAIDNGLKGCAQQSGMKVPELEAQKITSTVIGALVIAHFNPKLAAEICDQISAEVSVTYLYP